MAKIAAIVILFGLLVDGLGLAGIYIQFKVKQEMLLPMIIFYGLLIPSLTVTLILTPLMFSPLNNPYFYPVVLCAVILLVFYSFLIFNVIRLRRFKREGAAILAGFNQIILEPLTSKAKEHV